MLDKLAATLVAMLVLAASLLIATPALANETYQFETAAQEQQYRQLVNELRCPKCQNQTIADSDAPLAQDLRERVYLMTMEGQSRAEIIEFMRVRYGDFVHYKPPVNATTLVLWLGPATILLVGVLTVVLMVRRQRKQIELSPQEQARLERLLQDESSASKENQA